MLFTSDVIQGLADRIERAYRRTRPQWRPGCCNPGVWSAAAAALIQINRDDPAIPIDPELFVASQPGALPLDDPWLLLTPGKAARRYRRRVQQIVRRLRKELRGEVSQAEGRLHLGLPIEVAIQSWPDRLSPLGRFIVATRAGRPDLAGPWRAAAQDQHRSCPLYRQACRGLLPDGAYPAADPEPEESDYLPPAGSAPRFSIN